MDSIFNKPEIDRTANIYKREMDLGHIRGPIIEGEGNQYYISFTVTDVARANAFVHALRDKDEHIEDTLGISLDAIGFGNPEETNQKIRDILVTTIDQLQRI